MGIAADAIQRIEELRQNQVAEPNLDLWRFPGRTPNPIRDGQPEHIVDLVRAHAERYDRAGALLADEASRRLMVDLIAFRAHGPFRVKLPTNGPAYWAAYEEAATWRRPEPSDNVFAPWPIERFTGRHHGQPIELECWLGNIVFSFLLKQYVFSRPETASIEVSEGDYVIDAGVCFGDTAMAFAAAAGPRGRVLGFEPTPKQLAIARANLTRNPELAERITLVDRAVGETSDQTIRFASRGAGARASDQGDIEVRTMAIDDCVAAEGLKHVDFIKMDVEGAEGAALKGAARTIRDHRPVLAISVYHRAEDLFDLPLQIQAMAPDYRFHLDHYTIHQEETVLFAVPT
jgi:FkbM family methyltransferase